MSATHEGTVTFPIENGMFGAHSLAKHLNALVSDGQISDWHPGRWVDWGHTAIQQIDFDSGEDAARARHLLFRDTARLTSLRLVANASGWRAPEASTDLV
ncbi:MAG: hypothetical protein WAN86_25595 [Hyphomicrobiaceae bacterium]